jgi:hypothetical protein
VYPDKIIKEENVKKYGKDKLTIGLNAALLAAVLILLASVPFVNNINYSPFDILAVNITPSRKYKIHFDLPHTKPVTKVERKRAEARLSKILGIGTFSLNDDKLLSTPIVLLKWNPLSGKYSGSIRMGGHNIPFDRVENQVYGGKKGIPSKILLTAYFTLNGKVLRANIFIINNGSVLKYASMTVQDKYDNVLAMFTYGKANAVPGKESAINDAQGWSSPAGNSGKSFGEVEKVLKHQVKYITINDPFGNASPALEPVIRFDAMSNYPFNNSRGASNYLSSRMWGFSTPLENALSNFYRTAGWGRVHTRVYVNSISSVMETKFPSEINESNLYPKQSTYYSILPVGVLFNLCIAGNTIRIPRQGIQRVWELKNTICANTGMEPFNYGKFSAFPFSAFTWCDRNLFWNCPVKDALSNDNPDSSCGGFYCRYQVNLYASGSNLYACYSGHINYGIKVVSDTPDRVDYYCISVLESFPNVNLK